MSIIQKWYYGDGIVENVYDPTHRYPMPGVYTVKLEIYEDGALLGSVKKNLYISVTTWADNGLNVSQTNKCYRFGTSSKEGIGASEVSGDDWVFPNGKVQPIRLKDEDGIHRSIVFDANDRKFYEITSPRGVSSLGYTPIWRDKANVDGSGGTEYGSTLSLRGVTGGLERYFVEMLSTNIYSRPVDNSLLGGYSFDGNSYPSNLLVEVSVSDDDNKSEPILVAKKISMPKHEVVFDKRIEAHFLQTNVSLNTAPAQIVGVTQNIIAKDKLDFPDNRTLSEDDWQEEISCVTYWLSRGTNLLYDRVSGASNSLSNYSAVTGVDGYSDSAIDIPLGELLSIPLGGEVLFWYKDTTPVLSLPPSSEVVGTSGNWILAKATVSSNWTLGEGIYFDIRVYESEISDDAKDYLLSDVIGNNGNNTLPLWG